MLVSSVRRERDAARGTVDSIMEAIKGDRFTDGIQTAEDYVRHVLGTAGHLYHVEGYMAVAAERDRYKEALTVALDHLESYLRGESGLPAVTPYVAARRAAETIISALDDTKKGQTDG